MSTSVRTQTVKKYFNALTVLKHQFDEGSLNSIREFEKEFRISNRTYRTLVELNIISKNGSGHETYYSWNDKIPVTMLLAKKVLTKNNEINSYYKDRNKSKKIEASQTLVKKKGGARIGAGRPKAIVSKLVKKEVTNTKQVGLIRKFLRWIY
jgi:hypothetical protein